MRALMLQDMLLVLLGLCSRRKAFDPKSALKPTTLAKVAAEENSAKLKAKYKK
jgi:hypothetical protein